MELVPPSAEHCQDGAARGSGEEGPPSSASSAGSLALEAVHEGTSPLWLTTVAMTLVACGAGVLSLPAAAHAGSLLPTVALMSLAGIVQMYGSRTVALAVALCPSMVLSQSACTVLYGPDADAPPSMHDDDFRRARRNNLLFRRSLLMRVTDVLAYGHMLSLGIVYVRTIVDSIPHVLEEFGVKGDSIWAHRGPYLAFCFAFITPFVAMRSIKEMTAGTILGLATIVGFVVAMVVAYAVSGGDGFSSKEERDGVRYFAIDDGFVLMPQLIVASFSTSDMVPQLYSELKDRSPDHFFRASDSSAAILVLLYSTAAVVGYLTFGTAVASEAADGSVLNNYPATTLWSVMRIVVVVHMLFVAPIFLSNTRNGIVSIVYRLRGGEASGATHPQRLSPAIRLLQASGIVAFECVMAYFVPSISATMAVIGSYFGIVFFSGYSGLLGLTIYSGVWQGTPEAVLTGEPQRYLPSRKGQLASVGLLIGSVVVLVLTVLSEAGVLDAALHR